MKDILKAIKNFISQADMFLLTVCLIASVYGMVLIASATRSFGSNRFLLVQGVAVILGIFVFILFTLIDVETLASLWKWLLLFNLLFISLLFIPGLGVAGDTGNRSWLRPAWAPIGVQPAEVVKITFIIVLAYQLYAQRDSLSSIPSVAKLVAHLGLMVGLISVASYDDGMSLMYALIFVCMLLAAGVKFRWFLVGFALIAAASPLVWHFMKPYQRSRILVVIDPASDLLESGWHANQSKIALGAGKLFGRGLFEGTQTQRSILPAKHTDFIFSVAGEELGMIGCMAIIILLTIIILRCLYIATKAKSGISMLVCVGIAGMLLFQVFINIGMCIGFLPVIGLTLPFFSYGGSSILTLFAAMGIVSGVKMRPIPSWLKDRGR